MEEVSQVKTRRWKHIIEGGGDGRITGKCGMIPYTFTVLFPLSLLFSPLSIPFYLPHPVFSPVLSLSLLPYSSSSPSSWQAWTRTCMNLAQMLGPVVSGVLIEAGGFQLPFLVMGSLQVCMTLLCCLLPPEESGGCVEGRDGCVISGCVCILGGYC